LEREKWEMGEKRKGRQRWENKIREKEVKSFKLFRAQNLALVGRRS